MIFKIGSTLDVSAYVETGYSVEQESLYSDDYTTLNGNEHKTLLGYKYHINCNLGNVPAATAALICTALKSECSITFSFPNAITATFLAPTVHSTLITEGDQTATSGELWDIEISAVSKPQLNSL